MSVIDFDRHGDDVPDAEASHSDMAQWDPVVIVAQMHSISAQLYTSHITTYESCTSTSQSTRTFATAPFQLYTDGTVVGECEYRC